MSNLITQAADKAIEDFKYREAFAFIVGYITAGKNLDQPLSPKMLFQRVYDHYGIAPIPSICEELGLIIKEPNDTKK